MTAQRGDSAGQSPNLAGDQPWMDAARSVLRDYERFRAAKTPLDAAQELVELNNSMAQLVTWLPEYDERTGWLRDEDNDGIQPEGAQL